MEYCPLVPEQTASIVSTELGTPPRRNVLTFLGLVSDAGLCQLKHS